MSKMKNMTEFPVKEIIEQPFLKDWEKAKYHLRCRLVNTERNEQMLEYPHREMGDLSLVYTIFLGEAEGQTAHLHVSDPVLSSFCVTEEQLYEQALKNMENAEPATVYTLAEIIRSFGLSEDITPSTDRLLIVSNTSKQFGASSILCRSVDGIIRGRIGDYYILPSSVHEVLVVPKVDFDDMTVLTRMVMEVNDSCLAPSDFLSDNVYEMMDGQLKIAKEAERTKAA